MKQSHHKRTSIDVSTSQDRAVSPVIGVILMVAITVILAAVIGVFVLGLGDELGDGAAPQATLSLNDGVNNSYNFEMQHRSGDQLDLNDISILVDGTQADHWADNLTEQETLSAGERIQLDAVDNVTDEDTGALDGVENGQEVTIAIRHEPSNSILAESSVVLEGADPEATP